MNQCAIKMGETNVDPMINFKHTILYILVYCYLKLKDMLKPCIGLTLSHVRTGFGTQVLVGLSKTGNLS